MTALGGGPLTRGAEMESGRRVVLMTHDAATRSSITSLLGAAGESGVLEICSTLPQLVVQLEKSAAAVALVDVDPEPVRTLRELDPIIARFNQTRFVVLSGASGNELILEAMQIGARHLLPKRAIESDLVGILGRFMVTDVPTPTRRGGLYTVLSAGGGCGATTVALNLAYELQLHTSRSVLLVDLDVSYGALASYLGLESQYGLADVLSRRRQIDEELLRTTAQSFANHLHVLLSPASTRSSKDASLQFEALDEFFDACRRAYSYTVLDAPRHAPDITARLALGSAATFIVLQLSVKDIHVARAIFKSLTDRGVAPGSISMVVSRYHRRSVISLQQAKEALGRDSLELVSSDYRHSIESMTYGQPLAAVAPRSPLRKDLRDLALKLLEAPAVSPTPPTSR